MVANVSLRPRSAPGALPSGRSAALGCVLLAAALSGCSDPVMAEALSPSSRMELGPPAATEPGAPLRVISVVPMGEVKPQLVEQVANTLRAAIRADIRIEAPRPLPPEAFYEPRKRWRAEKLLKAIDADPPDGAWKTLIVVDVEISTTKEEVYDWGIGGLGSLGGHSSVVSTYLLRKHTTDKAMLQKRLARLAVHEFGHTLGLPHCEERACVMSDAKGRLIRSLDASSDRYCDKCQKVLPSQLLQSR